MTPRESSRRDALCASALQGPTDGKDLHYRRRLGERPAVLLEYTGRGLGLPHGRAEPAPPRPGPPQRGSPSGESPEMTRKAIFSEGRGLRVRIAGPAQAGA